MLKNREEAINKISSVIWNSYTPHEAAGWPPHMLDHIKSIIHNVSIAMVESIYTEQELDTRIDNIVLQKPEQI